MIKQWKISCFISGFGKLSAQYEFIDNHIERIEFLNKQFGKVGIEVLYAKQNEQLMTLPFGWLSKIDNFINNLIAWRV